MMPGRGRSTVIFSSFGAPRLRRSTRSDDKPLVPEGPNSRRRGRVQGLSAAPDRTGTDLLEEASGSDAKSATLAQRCGGKVSTARRVDTETGGS